MSLLSEMRSLPPLNPAELPEPTLEVSLLIPARNAGHSLEATVEEARKFLSRKFPSSFEIILMPNASRSEKATASGRSTFQIALELARKYPEVQVHVHDFPVGKGAALRTGFIHSRGRKVFFTDADLPYDLDFFETASNRLDAGVDFLTGNRRRLDSFFDVPVELLKLAYRRHRLGLGFNSMVRILLPIRTTDTQAGIKAMTRKLATEAFSLQICPGFFFDLEFFLAAKSRGFKHEELPVTLYLNTEKSTVKVFRQGILALFWLARIGLRNMRSRYQ